VPSPHTRATATLDGQHEDYYRNFKQLPLSHTCKGF
jgi:hypothetical protein